MQQFLDLAASKLLAGLLANPNISPHADRLDLVQQRELVKLAVSLARTLEEELSKKE